MKTKKSLGQHFLRSRRALVKIIEAGAVDEKDIVLEIGPGMGALTEKLLETRCKLIAVEKDDNLYELLKVKFQKEISSGQLKLVHHDILNFKPLNYKLKARSYKLIANIPYSITGSILKKFLEIDCQPEVIVLLVQKEVARRILGKPHSAKASRGKESILSISVKAYGTPAYIETVKAGSFAPAPKVDSAIISIQNISKKFFRDICGIAIDSVDTECLREVERRFFEIVRAGFKSKRKKLSSNLSMKFSKDKVQETFQKLNLDDNLRAEDVDIDTWGKVVNTLCGA